MVGFLQSTCCTAVQPLHRRQTGFSSFRRQLLEQSSITHDICTVARDFQSFRNRLKTISVELFNFTSGLSSLIQLAPQGVDLTRNSVWMEPKIRIEAPYMYKVPRSRLRRRQQGKDMVPPPQPTRGLEEHHKLPINEVRGRTPAENEFSCI